MGNGHGTEGEYLTPSEAATLLKVSPKTVSRWAADGRIEHIVTLGGHRRFPRVEVERVRASMSRGGPSSRPSLAEPPRARR